MLDLKHAHVGAADVARAECAAWISATLGSVGCVAAAVSASVAERRRRRSSEGSESASERASERETRTQTKERARRMHEKSACDAS